MRRRCDGVVKISAHRRLGILDSTASPWPHQARPTILRNKIHISLFQDLLLAVTRLRLIYVATATKYGYDNHTADV